MTEKQKHGQSLCPGGKEAPLSRNDCKVCKGANRSLCTLERWTKSCYGGGFRKFVCPSAVQPTLNLNTIQDSKDLQRSATRPVFCMSCSSSLEEIFAGHQVHDNAPSSLPTNKSKVEGRKMVWSCHPSTCSTTSSSSFPCSTLVSLRTAVLPFVMPVSKSSHLSLSFATDPKRVPIVFIHSIQDINMSKIEGRRVVWSCHPSTSFLSSSSSFLCSPLVSLRTADLLFVIYTFIFQLCHCSQKGPYSIYPLDTHINMSKIEGRRVVWSWCKDDCNRTVSKNNCN